MSCEPTQGWVSELLAAVGVVQADPKNITKSTTEGESPEQSERQADCLTGHTESGIDTLRLCIKYLVFDVQATRRENTCLRKMLAECKNRDGEA